MAGGNYEMPPAIDYMTAIFARCLGLTATSGNGIGVIAPSELLAFGEGCDLTLSAWEFETIINMSSAYVGGYYQQGQAPPYRTKPLQVSFSKFMRG